MKKLDIKKVEIYQNGKKVETVKWNYSEIDSLIAKYKEEHDGDFKFKINLMKFGM